MTLSPISQAHLSASSQISLNNFELEVCDLSALKSSLIQKGIIDDQGVVLKDAPPLKSFPDKTEERFQEVLNKPFTIKTKKGATLGEITLKKLLAQLPYQFEIVGSTVLYILGQEYLISLLETLGIKFSESLKGQISSLYSKGNDIDLRAPSTPKATHSVAQGKFCDALADLLGKNSYEIFQTGFQKMHLMKGSDVFVATIGDGAGEDIDFIIWEKLTRFHFATKDALQLQINNKSILTRGSTFLQPFLDHLFKVIRVDQPHTVDHNGWSRVLSLRLKGYSTVDPGLEETLLNTLTTSQVYNGDMGVLVLLLTHTAKTHHLKEPDALIRLAYLATPTLISVVSPQDFADFWEKLLEKSKDTHYLGALFAKQKTPSKELLNLFQIALPFFEDPFLKLTRLNTNELLSVFKNYGGLLQAFTLSRSLPFGNLNELLFKRLLDEAHPYPFWEALKPHLTPDELSRFSKLIKDKLYGNRPLQEEFIEDISLSMASMEEASDDDVFNFYFEKMALTALESGSKEAVKSHSLIHCLIKIASNNSSRLISHDTYKELIFLALSLKRGNSPSEYHLNFRKISNPEERLKAAFILANHRCPFHFDNVYETLNNIDFNLENDAKIRDLFKGKQLQDVPVLFFFYWINKVVQKQPSKNLRPWIFILLGGLKPYLKDHKNLVESFLLNLVPLIDEGIKECYEVIKLSEIKSPSLNSALVQVCLPKKDKSSREVLWSLLPSIQDPSLWEQSVKKPCAQMLMALRSPLNFLSKPLATQLLESILQTTQSLLNNDDHLGPLLKLRSLGTPSLSFLKWLLSLSGMDSFICAGHEINALTPFPKKEHLAWINKLIALDPPSVKVVLEKAGDLVEKLSLVSDVKLEDQIRINVTLGKIEEAFLGVKHLKGDTSLFLNSLIEKGEKGIFLIHLALNEAAIEEKIPAASKSKLAMKLLQLGVKKGLSLSDPKLIAPITQVCLHDFSFIDSNNSKDEETALLFILKLMEKEIQLTNDFADLNINLVRLQIYLAYHSIRRCSSTKRVNLTLQDCLVDVEKNKELLKGVSHQLPSTAHNPPLQEAAHLLKLGLMVPKMLMNLSPVSEEAKEFISNYTFSLLYSLLLNQRELFQLGMPLMDKLIYYIKPAENHSWRSHWGKCIKLFQLFLAGPPDQESALFALRMRTRLDPEIYPWEQIQFHQKTPFEGFPYGYIQNIKMKALMPSEVIIEEVCNLLEMNKPYPLFRALQIFALQPDKLFNYPELSGLIWAEIIKNAGPHLAVKMGKFDIVTYMVNGFYHNKFFEKGTQEEAFNHVKTLFNLVLKEYQTQREIPILFALYFILRNAMGRKIHVGLESKMLDFIEKLTPYGTLWSGINENDAGFIALFDLISALNPSDVKNKERGYEVLKGWLTHVKASSGNDKEPLLIHVKNYLNLPENRKFYKRKDLLSDLKPVI